MKYKGQQIVCRPQRDVLVFQTEKGEIAFTLEAVVDLSEFNAIYPAPQPKPTLKPGGERGFDTESSDFKKKSADHSRSLTEWLILKTLSATPDLEWETIKSDDPTTWGNYREELKQAGFTPSQVSYIINRCININTIDDTMMMEARNRFLAGQQEASVQ